MPSISRRGNCYCNVHAEPFRSRPRTELLDGGNFPRLEEAKPEIDHHIFYYNAERCHPSLGYLASNHFETHLQTTSQRFPA
ncbi:integrase core domain-containing protein [Hymenobacter perfusus]|uniref:integrase core domain-containing protein n=1 Tax=Hymenobacter perfusus TaxID=1236770 RepID=UPI0037429A12